MMALIVCMVGLLGLFTPKGLKLPVVGAFAAAVTCAVLMGGLPGADV